MGCALFRIPKPNTADMAENTAENIPVAEKVVVTLGKRKRIVAFKSEASESDKAIVIKRIREEFRDRLKDDRCEIVLQMKNVEVDDFIEVGDGDVIEDKAILEFFTKQSDVREFLNTYILLNFLIWNPLHYLSYLSFECRTRQGLLVVQYYLHRVVLL